jgi:hypothetical protein
LHRNIKQILAARTLHSQLRQPLLQHCSTRCIKLVQFNQPKHLQSLATFLCALQQDEAIVIAPFQRKLILCFGGVFPVFVRNFVAGSRPADRMLACDEFVRVFASKYACSARAALSRPCA